VTGALPLRAALPSMLLALWVGAWAQQLGG
jgi:hypothetical protein